MGNFANRHLWSGTGIKSGSITGSLEAQGIEREVTVHLGYAAIEMDKRGAQSDRMEALQAVMARNEIRFEMKAIDRELITWNKPNRPPKAETRRDGQGGSNRARRHSKGSGTCTGGVRWQGTGSSQGWRSACRRGRYGRDFAGVGKALDGLAGMFENFLEGSPAPPRTPAEKGRSRRSRPPHQARRRLRPRRRPLLALPRRSRSAARGGQPCKSMSKNARSAAKSCCVITGAR